MACPGRMAAPATIAGRCSSPWPHSWSIATDAAGRLPSTRGRNSGGRVASAGALHWTDSGRCSCEMSAHTAPLATKMGKALVDDSVLGAKYLMKLVVQEITQVSVVADAEEALAESDVAIDDELGRVALEVRAQVFPSPGDDAIVSVVVGILQAEDQPIEREARDVAGSRASSCIQVDPGLRGTLPPHEYAVFLLGVLAHVDGRLERLLDEAEPDGVDDEEEQGGKAYPASKKDGTQEERTVWVAALPYSRKSRRCQEHEGRSQL
jgi:hypothetical protein